MPEVPISIEVPSLGYKEAIIYLPVVPRRAEMPVSEAAVGGGSEGDEGSKEEGDNKRERDQRHHQGKGIEMPAIGYEGDTSEEVISYIEIGDLPRVPVPKAEILATAGTTSVVSVGATLGATALFKRLVSIMKPMLKRAAKQMMRANDVGGMERVSWGRSRLIERKLNAVSRHD